MQFQHYEKPSLPGHHLKPISLKEYHNKKLCPVDLINIYLGITAIIRAGESELLLNHRKPNAARNCGARITDILTAAGWSSKRTFAKYYDKQILAVNVI